MDYWYCALHYLVTPVVLGWLYVRRRSDYAPGPQRARRLLRPGPGLLPRLPDRTAEADGRSRTSTRWRATPTSGGGAEHASAPAGLGGLTNELAAMPSLHVGWAVWVAWAGTRTHTAAGGLPSTPRHRTRRGLHRQPLGPGLRGLGLLVTLAGIGAATWWSRHARGGRPRGLGHGETPPGRGLVTGRVSTSRPALSPEGSRVVSTSRRRQRTRGQGLDQAGVKPL